MFKKSASFIRSNLNSAKAAAFTLGTMPLLALADDPQATVTAKLIQAAIDVAAIAGLSLLVYVAPKVFKYMRGGL
jgi:hypothetical protein